MVKLGKLLKREFYNLYESNVSLNPEKVKEYRNVVYKAIDIITENTKLNLSELELMVDLLYPLDWKQFESWIKSPISPIFLENIVLYFCTSL